MQLLAPLAQSRQRPFGLFVGRPAGERVWDAVRLHDGDVGGGESLASGRCCCPFEEFARIDEVVA